MAVVDLAQPDVTLLLDMGGVIREASVSSVLSNENVSPWLGQSWRETVPEIVGDKIRRIIDDARDTGISAFRQLTQRFPSGREVPMEYTTVLLGGRGGMMAVGKSLLAVAELQSRFVAAQQSLERDYWKLREVETRYRLLFNHSSEAVLLLRDGSFHIIEANPAAIQILGLVSDGEHGAGQDLLAAISEPERANFLANIRRAHEEGKAPGALVHLGRARVPWLVRTSSVKGDSGPLLMVRFVPAGPVPSSPEPENLPSLETALQGIPDGFVMLASDGTILRANGAFADMVDMGSAQSVVGEKLDRWVWRPGADLPAILALLREHRVARLFPSSLRSELGTEMEIEVSGVGLSQGDLVVFTLIIRDVGRRVEAKRDPKAAAMLIDSIAQSVGKIPLRQLIRSTVDGVERHYVKAALDLSGGNRTAAAEILGLSRQSLYSKLDRYGFEEHSVSSTNDSNGGSDRG